MPNMIIALESLTFFWVPLISLIHLIFTWFSLPTCMVHFWKPLGQRTSMQHLKITLEPLTSFVAPIISLIHLIFTLFTWFSEHQFANMYGTFLKTFGSEEFHAAPKINFETSYLLCGALKLLNSPDFHQIHLICIRSVCQHVCYLFGNLLVTGDQCST